MRQQKSCLAHIFFIPAPQGAQKNSAPRHHCLLYGAHRYSRLPRCYATGQGRQRPSNHLLGHDLIIPLPAIDSGRMCHSDRCVALCSGNFSCGLYHPKYSLVPCQAMPRASYLLCSKRRAKLNASLLFLHKTLFGARLTHFHDCLGTTGRPICAAQTQHIAVACAKLSPPD